MLACFGAVYAALDAMQGAAVGFSLIPCVALACWPVGFDIMCVISRRPRIGAHSFLKNPRAGGGGLPRAPKDGSQNFYTFYAGLLLLFFPHDRIVLEVIT